MVLRPTQEWLDHIRLSSVRLNDGGSGSFVSPNGLLLTNHHVARGQLQKNSTAEHDYLRDGFYADSPDKEMKSPDLEVNVLVGMQNVTARVQGAAKGIADEAKALKAREAEIAAIEKESKDKTGLRSDVVSLYDGRRVLALSVQGLHRCAPGVRAGAAGGLLWRRSG